MRNKKTIVAVAGLAALTVAGGSFAAYAAETEVTGTEATAYSCSTMQYADNAEMGTDKANYSYIGGQAKGVQYADSEGADEDTDKSLFSIFTKPNKRCIIKEKWW